MFPLIVGVISIALATFCALPSYLLHLGKLGPQSALAVRMPATNKRGGATKRQEEATESGVNGEDVEAAWQVLQRAVRPLQLLASGLALINGFAFVAFVPPTAPPFLLGGLALATWGVPSLLFALSGVVARKFR